MQVKEHADAQWPSGIPLPTEKASTGGKGRKVTAGSTGGIVRQASSAAHVAAATSTFATATSAMDAATHAGRVDQRQLHRRRRGRGERAVRVAIRNGQ